ncbi:MAG TPA: branched-chain amino acid ABC transporter ATP-binding protein/permease [Gaiellaceae bacterium]|nr:branched-chain amino acid ABC transporter ATP-binding protein/permease [Gaiellaceae bacterium]
MSEAVQHRSAGATALGLVARHAAKAGVIGLLLTILVFPLISDNRYYQTIIILSLLLAVMASGWNIISGFAGYVSLGQTVFLGIGAYTTAILSLRVFGPDEFGQGGANPFYFVPLSALVAGLFAAAVGPILMRTRGHSFVILTIAFLFVMQLIVLNWTELTYGNRGLSLPLPTWPREWANLPFYYVFFGLMLLSVAMSWWIRRTKFGMGLIAIREDEDKAASVGVNTPIYKTLAFVASAIWIGAAGGVYAYYLSFIDPRNQFDIVYSVFVVLAVLLGGRGTIWGPVIGAFILEPVNQITNNDFNRWFGEGVWDANVRLIFFGALLLLVVLVLPRGIIPSLREIFTRRRESKTAAEVGARFERTPMRVVERGAQEARAAPAGPLLEIRGVSKRFGGITAVDDVSLAVERGTITALIGPNGSGKTTLFNLIDGTMEPDRGEVWFEGRRVDKLAPYRRAHLGIGRTFQITRLFREMTVLENVVAPLRSFSWRRLGADAVSGPEAERAHGLLEFVGMHRFAHHRAGALSFGQGKLVELAQILMLDPALIMLDEPAGGINPTLIGYMEEMVRELNRQGTTFLIVEHNMPLVLGLCSPVCVLARGQAICEGTPGQVQADPAVLDAYLGEDFVLEERAGVS